MKHEDLGCVVNQGELVMGGAWAWAGCKTVPSEYRTGCWAGCVGALQNIVFTAFRASKWHTCTCDVVMAAVACSTVQQRQIPTYGRHVAAARTRTRTVVGFWARMTQMTQRRATRKEDKRSCLSSAGA